MEYTYKQEFIRFMVSNGVLKFGEFTLKAAEKLPILSTRETIKRANNLQNLVSIMRLVFKKTSWKRTRL